MAIQDVIAHAQSSISSSVSAIKYAPDYPTDKRISVPTAISYATNISFEMQGGFVLTFFDLRIDVMIPRRDLADAMQFLASIPEAVAAVFTVDPTIGGHCQTHSGNIKANILTATIDAIDMIGYSIIVERIKI